VRVAVWEVAAAVVGAAEAVVVWTGLLAVAVVVLTADEVAAEEVVVEVLLQPTKLTIKTIMKINADTCKNFLNIYNHYP